MNHTLHPGATSLTFLQNIRRLRENGQINPVDMMDRIAIVFSGNGVIRNRKPHQANREFPTETLIQIQRNFESIKELVTKRTGTEIKSSNFWNSIDC